VKVCLSIPEDKFVLKSEPPKFPFLKLIQTLGLDAEKLNLSRWTQHATFCNLPKAHVYIVRWIFWSFPLFYLFENWSYCTASDVKWSRFSPDFKEILKMTTHPFTLQQVYNLREGSWRSPYCLSFYVSDRFWLILL